MKNLKLPVFIVILALTAISAYPQQKLRGKVVEILDGRTIVIELYTSYKIKAQLQFIEVPEPEQPLSQIVKEHLQKLVLDQDAEFQPVRLLNSMSVGRVFVNGVDVSQQMIRDGAAWYAVLEKNAQSPNESEIYQKTEAQAKTEKRGVWSIENVKPAWEFRAEKERNREREQEKVESGSGVRTTLAEELQKREQKPRPAMTTEFGSSAFGGFSKFESNKANGNSELYSEKIPNTNISYISTGTGFFRFAAARSEINIESRAANVYLNNSSVLFLIAFRSGAQEWQMMQSNELTFVAGKQKIFSVKSSRSIRDVESDGQRLIFYEVTREALEKAATTQNLIIKIGKFSGKISDDYRTYIEKLLYVTESKN